MKRIMTLIAVVSAVMLVATAAWAGKLRFSSVEFSVGSFQAEGAVVGAGQTGDGFEFQLTASGQTDGTCLNKGGNKPVGVNDATATVTGSASGVADENGRVDFALESTVQFDSKKICPNRNYNFVAGFSDWKTVTIEVIDDTGLLILRGEWTGCSTDPETAQVNCATFVQTSF